MNLVPFGEFVPRPFKALVDRVSTEGGDFAAGEWQVVLAAGAHESVFPDFLRRFADMGADLYVNISNGGWYGKTAARAQHLKIMRTRAAESLRWILRATNDGITSTMYRDRPPYTDAAVGTSYSYVKDVTSIRGIAIGLCGCAWMRKKA